MHFSARPAECLEAHISCAETSWEIIIIIIHYATEIAQTQYSHTQ